MPEKLAKLPVDGPWGPGINTVPFKFLYVVHSKVYGEHFFLLGFIDEHESEHVDEQLDDLHVLHVEDDLHVLHVEEDLQVSHVEEDLQVLQVEEDLQVLQVEEEQLLVV